jgi:MFS family permease
MEPAGGSGYLHPGVAARTVRAMRHRNFRLFFFGQLTSLVGSWMQSVAQGWLVWRLTHSTTMLGLVGFCQFAPVLVLGLLGGVAADRFNRHRLVITTQSALLAQSVLLAALTLLGVIQVWQILVLALLLGTVNAFDMTGRQAFLVQMVGREDLGNAIALNSSAFNGARIVGPALAGFVVERWGEGTCFAINSVSFLAVLGSLLAMHLEKQAPPMIPESTLAYLKEGFVYAWRTPQVRHILGLLVASSLVALPYSFLLPAVVGGLLGRDATSLGILWSFAGVGALTAALFIAGRIGARGLGRLAGLAATGFGIFLMAFGLSSNFILSCALITGLGFCMMTQLASTNTLVQHLSPEALRGRVVSLYVIMFIGVAPVGGLLQGRLAKAIGLREMLVVGGLLGALSGIAFLASIPWVRRRMAELQDSSDQDGGISVPAEEDL